MRKETDNNDMSAGEWDLLWVKIFYRKTILPFAMSATETVLAEFSFFANGISHRVPLY